jgi:type II secretory pathway component GspD/PulD (secretin)
MKIKHLAAILLATFTTAWLAAAADDTTNAPAADVSATNAPPDAATPPPDAATPPPEAAKPEQPAIPTPADTEPAPTNGLVLNFHDVPLTAVLTYLSAKAGLIIVSDVSLQGRVSVVAAQPITTNDIVTLLNDQLGKNNFSAILQGRTLTIMDSERAKTYALTPVKIAIDYTNIPIDDEIVTEILPLHTLNAQQLVKDLADLIPRNAVITANEAGNSIIMTAQQKDVRRIDQIINSLDGSALSEVEVFQLNYADSKSVADELKEVFQSADSDITRASTRNNFRSRGGGGGGGPFGGGGMAAMFGGGGGGGNNGGGEDKNISTHAVFVADDQMNAVIASAPPDYMRMITNVVHMLDQPSQEVTVLRVFHLNNADPGEIADELTTMFPSTTTTDQNNRTAGMRFMGFGGFGGGGGGQSAANQSPRMKRQLTVMVVPDRRTQSVLVSASKDMMAQIQAAVEVLDLGKEGVQHVTALDFGGADPATVEQAMTGLFLSANSKNQPSSTASQTPIGNRFIGNANSQTTTAQTAATSSTSMGAPPK